MKLSREYITDRLKNTSVQDLAAELADQTAEAYKGRGTMDRAATIAKFKAMLEPLAPKTTKIRATDVMAGLGVQVNNL